MMISPHGVASVGAWFAYHGLFTDFLGQIVGSTGARLRVWTTCALVHTLPLGVVVAHAGEPGRSVVRGVETVFVSLAGSLAVATECVGAQGAGVRLNTSALGLCAAHLASRGGEDHLPFLVWVVAEALEAPGRRNIVYTPMGILGFVWLALHVPSLAFSLPVLILQHAWPGSEFVNLVWVCVLGAGLGIDAHLF